MDQLAKIAAQLASAKTPEQMFGVQPTDQVRRYKYLIMILHPDKWEHDPASRALAEKLFATVTQEWQRLKDRQEARFTIATGGGTYKVNGLAAQGDLSNLYRVAKGGDPDGDEQWLLKLPRSPHNTDLMLREAQALSAIAKTGSRRVAFVPQLVDSFRHRDLANGIERRINILERFDGFFSVEEIGLAYPNGLDIRDVVWMWRRALLALSIAHQAGYVHGAVLPCHVLIHPAKHGTVLVDWCYSTKLGQRVPALVPAYRSLYAPEIVKKQPVSTSTDIYMLTKTMASLFDSDVPQQFKAFVKGCTQELQKGRPDDARRILLALTDLVERLFGKRTFREFNMPRELRTVDK